MTPELLLLPWACTGAQVYQIRLKHVHIFSKLIYPTENNLQNTTVGQLIATPNTVSLLSLKAPFENLQIHINTSPEGFGKLGQSSSPSSQE